MAERDAEPMTDADGVQHLRLPHTIGEIRDAEEHLRHQLQHKRQTRRESEAAKESLTLGQRVADGVAATMGSWRFIIIQSIILAFWIAANVVGFVEQWDPYPFILLNL